MIRAINNYLHRLRIYETVRISRQVLVILFTEGPVSLFKKAALRRRDPLQYQYELWLEKHGPGAGDYERFKREPGSLRHRPLISIVMPVYNVERCWLEKAIDSVRAQIYPDWELCIADDASTEPQVREVLSFYEGQDSRVKVKYLEGNRGIAGATNEALSLAGGEYIGLLDNDDELAPEALLAAVKIFNSHPDADMVYSDEDKINVEGKRCQPFFKPDWSPDLLLCHMYTCHFGVYRKSIVEKIGGFRHGFEGSQDYDFVLRFTEETDSVYHIPEVLYHWRIIPGSTADSYDVKGSDDASLKALNEAAGRRHKGSVEKGIWPGTFRVRYPLKQDHRVSIIIPTRDKAGLLKKCIDSVRRMADYPAYEVLVVDNRSVEGGARKLLDEIAGSEDCRVLSYDAAFNYAAINNMAAREAAGDVLLFLNNDTEVISREWLVPMLELATRSDVGAVGAKLIFEDGTIQHAGILLGAGGIANHAFYRYPAGRESYFNQADTIRNASAVTGACMMTRKELFQEAGGFDETNCPIAFNDVDYCLRLREKGYLIVYTPHAVLYHYEAVSRGNKDDPEAKYMEKRWRGLIRNDPYFNPNFSRERFDFSLNIS